MHEVSLPLLEPRWGLFFLPSFFFFFQWENKVNSYSNQLKLSWICKLEWSLIIVLYEEKEDSFLLVLNEEQTLNNAWFPISKPIRIINFTSFKKWSDGVSFKSFTGVGVLRSKWSFYILQYQPCRMWCWHLVFFKSYFFGVMHSGIKICFFEHNCHIFGTQLLLL